MENSNIFFEPFPYLENIFLVCMRHNHKVDITSMIFIPGKPASCSFKTCLPKKELCERNKTEFSCIHIEETKASEATEPEEELLLEDCRSIISYLFSLDLSTHWMQGRWGAQMALRASMLHLTSKFIF